MNKFDIIEYLSGLTAFVFDKTTLKRIATERGVLNVASYEELSSMTKDLLKADLFFTAYYSPIVWASSTNSHGSYSKSIGNQTLTATEKERLYNTFYFIYKKYNDDKLEEAQANESTLQWLDF